MPTPDEVKRWAAERERERTFRDWLGEKARAVGGEARRVAGEIGESVMGPPGSPYGEAMGAVVAGARSVLPSGASYREELRRVKDAREQRYPGAYSVVDEGRIPAMKQAQRDDMESAAFGVASPIAYHGSPHVFPKFDLSKIGTGEGNQAYGHGLYFTSEPKVAEQYRTAVSAAKSHGAWAERGRKLTGTGDPAPSVVAQAEQELSEAFNRNPGDLEGAYREVLDGWKNTAKFDPGWAGPAVAHLSAMDPAAFARYRPPGAFYEVDIPDKLLDYDRGISAQPPEVIAKLEAAKILPPGTGRYLELSRQLDEIAGAPIPKGADAAAESAARNARWDALRAEQKKIDLSRGGRVNFDPDTLDSFFMNRYRGQDVLRDAAPDPAAASAALRSAGIPGHRYKGDSSGVENYVIYDDAQIKPLGRFPSLAEFLRSKQTPNQ
jgi:hypothetical protein